MFLCSLYCPPERAARERRAGMLALMRWLHLQLQDLPTRTLPLLFMDANSRVAPSAHGEEVVGPHVSGTTNWNGRQLVDLCRTSGLSLLNTWDASACGASWTDGRGRFSRIDYIAAPATFTTSVRRVMLWHKTAIQLQASKSPYW
eukprot:11959848-Heterocapsa_arctica.AAC.1